MSEVQRYMGWTEFGYSKEMVKLSDYDALAAQFDALAEAVGFSQARCEQAGDSPIDCAQQLAAQRDEGLAREAKLRSEISIYQNEYVKYSELAAAEQRLAEAETLTPRMIQAFIDMWIPGFCNEQMAKGCWEAMMKVRSRENTE